MGWVDIEERYAKASKYLPIDWLLYRDLSTKLPRHYKNNLGYIIKTVPTYILKNGQKREDECTTRLSNYNADDLVISEPQEVIICSTPATAGTRKADVRLLNASILSRLPPIRKSIQMFAKKRMQNQVKTLYKYIYGHDSHVDSTQEYTTELTYVLEEQEFRNIYYTDTNKRVKEYRRTKYQFTKTNIPTSTDSPPSNNKNNLHTTVSIIPEIWTVFFEGTLEIMKIKHIMSTVIF